MLKFQQKQCHFCSQNIDHPDYKDTEMLGRFTSSQAKIVRTKYTGVCAKHQRRLANAVKRARFMGLLPYTARVK
ncbi:MAG: 30S ribosomal protein S18 [Candidatus Harrisonbacteria bacterium CG10_big_fil_rev_8_21_14_0_10_45_28]|uniref:Small ribosomal subunit protein bS18 n=1 Tax=Candidatus Harrisonbacteria bacterium CG10_big_fil_rev_8_21_14_0_10_45_28 TaxID=1974586 RepID=A0A2H0UQE6_9BACT|nr:MAG: 30S ribosomal protein S18 [Candidatus Harrisonbacteria bacterium CG10_big_fil_rev_8_21_14_0_10_45_28]